MTSDISDHLFVYGTLMRGFDHPMAQLLSRRADFVGEARCRGRLYLVKHYPGLVRSDDPGDVVFGELYRLRSPDELLREFDIYEACGEGFKPPTEYIRKMLSVTLANGATYTCVQTRDSTPLDPDAVEFKYYAAAVGLVLEAKPDGSQRVELLSVAQEN